MKTKTKTYRWKRAANVTADPNLVGAELEKLAKRGPLRADVVVEAARPHDSPMHRIFPCLPNGDWDDSEAGVGAGRPFSTMSVGQGWGTFEIATDKRAMG